MEDNSILVANIGWSPGEWQGFDWEMFRNKRLYNFEFITNTGFGHELWNFYENFKENVYFGFVQGRWPRRFTSGIVLFVSKQIDPNDPSFKRSRFYFVGVYGYTLYDPGKFNTGVKFIDLLPEEAVQNITHIVETRNWLGNDPERHLSYLEAILDGKEYKAPFVASKKYSTALLPVKYNGYVELNLQEDLGIKNLRGIAYTTREKALRLLEIAIFRHERIVKNETEITPSYPIRERAIEIVSRLKRVKKMVEASV